MTSPRLRGILPQNGLTLWDTVFRFDLQSQSIYFALDLPGTNGVRIPISATFRRQPEPMLERVRHWTEELVVAILSNVPLLHTT